MKNKYLLGFNNDNEVVFAEFEIDNMNGYPRFSASFDCVRPFEVKETDGIEYMQELLDSCYDDDYKYKLCERFDCPPSELAERMAEDQGIDTNADELDCSAYPVKIKVDGVQYAFESMSCGQHDIRDEGLKECVSQSKVDALLYLWDNYHLKEIKTDNLKDMIEDLQKDLFMSEETQQKIISMYIEKYIDELD